MDIESVSLQIRTATATYHIDRRMTNKPPYAPNVARHSLLVVSEWAAWNDHETLMAAAVMVAGTSAVTAQSMPTYGSSWPSELELWVVCSITTAALGCETPAGRAEGT